MVLRKSGNRVRGHKYISGFGAGDVKPNINVGNNQGANDNNFKGRHRSYDNVQYRNDALNTDREENNNSETHQSLRRRGHLSKRNDINILDDEIRRSTMKDKLPPSYTDVSAEDWKEAYLMKLGTQQNKREFNLASDTGSNELFIGSGQHFYRRDELLTPDIWHFSAFFVCFATVILVIAMFLNMLSDHYSSTNSAMSSTSILEPPKKSGPVGPENPGTNGTSNCKKPTTRNIRRIPRNPEKKNDDYNNMSIPIVSDGSSTHKSATDNNTNVLLEDTKNGPRYYHPSALIHQNHQSMHRKRTNSASTPVSGSGTTATVVAVNGLMDVSVPNSGIAGVGVVSGNYSPPPRRRVGILNSQRHQTISVKNVPAKSGSQHFNNTQQVLDSGTNHISVSSEHYRQQPPPRFQHQPSISNRGVPDSPFPYLSSTETQFPITGTSPSLHSTSPKFATRNSNRWLYARPISATGSSFGSAVDHPELSKPTPPDTGRSLAYSNHQKYDIDGYTDCVPSPLQCADDEIMSTNPDHHDYIDMMTTTSVQTNRSSSQKPYIRVKNVPQEITSPSLKCAVSPRNEDNRYWIGFNEKSQFDNTDQYIGKAVALSNNDKLKSFSSGQHFSISTTDQKTPNNGKAIQSFRSPQFDYLDSTPRVTNGRQILGSAELARSNSNRRDSGLPFEVIAEQPIFPSLVEQRTVLQEYGYQDASDDDNSKINSFGGPNMGFSNHGEMPPTAPKIDDGRTNIRVSDPESGTVVPSAIPFVPSLVTNVTMPPVSVNIDGLDLILRTAEGEVSHWEENVKATSKIVQDKPNDRMDSNSDWCTDRKDYDVRALHEPSQRFYIGNIEDIIMDFAPDAQSSNGTIPSDDPRKGVKHIRENLTEATDAASSLQNAIEFKELKLIDVIGGGGFGQVWRAKWLGTPVAVKVLTGSAQSKAVPRAVLQEFAAEINLFKGMRHPNICLYMGACIIPPNRAIITELAANGSLWDALRLPLAPPYSPCDGVTRNGWPIELYQPDARHGAPPLLSSAAIKAAHKSASSVPPQGAWHWVLVKNVARGAARGMAYLHSGKPPVLHRDLKSANILLDGSYTAKVCDFGLSRLKAHESSMTGNCGTVQWMAPEVLSSEHYNEKADVFSFGIICWELLSAECPYDGMAPIQCALSVLRDDLRPDIPKWCPPPLQALIRSCWRRDPSERPTFEQVIAAFDAMP